MSWCTTPRRCATPSARATAATHATAARGVGRPSSSTTCFRVRPRTNSITRNGRPSNTFPRDRAPAPGSDRQLRQDPPSSASWPWPGPSAAARSSAPRTCAARFGCATVDDRLAPGVQLADDPIAASTSPAAPRLRPSRADGGQRLSRRSRKRSTLPAARRRGLRLRERRPGRSPRSLGNRSSYSPACRPLRPGRGGASARRTAHGGAETVSRHLARPGVRSSSLIGSPRRQESRAAPPRGRSGARPRRRAAGCRAGSWFLRPEA